MRARDLFGINYQHMFFSSPQAIFVFYTIIFIFFAKAMNMRYNPGRGEFEEFKNIFLLSY
jgi:hypothetical protein